MSSRRGGPDPASVSIVLQEVGEGGDGHVFRTTPSAVKRAGGGAHNLSQKHPVI